MGTGDGVYLDMLNVTRPDTRTALLFVERYAGVCVCATCVCATSGVAHASLCDVYLLHTARAADVCAPTSPPPLMHPLPRTIAGSRSAAPESSESSWCWSMSSWFDLAVLCAVLPHRGHHQPDAAVASALHALQTPQKPSLPSVCLCRYVALMCRCPWVWPLHQGCSATPPAAPLNTVSV